MKNAQIIAFQEKVDWEDELSCGRQSCKENFNMTYSRE